MGFSNKFLLGSGRSAPLLEIEGEGLESSQRVTSRQRCEVRKWLEPDENQEIAQKYGVRGIPTLMFFNKGKLIDTRVGSLPKSSLDEWLDSLLDK